MTPQEGGSLFLSGGPSLNMPPQALAQDLEISMELLNSSMENRARTAASELSRLLPASNAIQLGPEGTRFSQPVELEVPYSVDQLDGAKESDLKLYYWNPASSEWQAVETSKVNTLAKTVTAQLDHFSIYQVLAPAQAIAPTAVADAGFFFRELYAFPNPSRQGETVTIRTQVGLADSVAIKIYDVSGQLLHSASPAAPKILDDGNGKGVQYTYDYSWDVSGIGSGVYLYAITAKRIGHPDIRKTGKAAVLK